MNGLPSIARYIQKCLSSPIGLRFGMQVCNKAHFVMVKLPTMVVQKSQTLKSQSLVPLFYKVPKNFFFRSKCCYLPISAIKVYINNSNIFCNKLVQDPIVEDVK